MTLQKKIILGMINFACYFYTMLYPCDVTVFSLLPSIVTSSSWILDISKRKQNNWLDIVLLVVACSFGMFCVFMGFSSVMDTGANGSNYVFKFRTEVAFVGGRAFAYSWFFVIAIVVFLGINIPDLILSRNITKLDEPQKNFDKLSSDRINVCDGGL